MTQKKLGRYDLIRVLGKGAMGLVYEGRDPNLDRRVAIKTIRVENLSEEAAIEYEARFRTEARSAARLQHPNIVSVYDSNRDGDIAYLVMEFIQGEDLKHHLDQGKRHTLEQTLAVMGDLLSALDYAHAANIVHRDIKPANLLVEASGRVKLTDFGVARIQDSGDVTRTQGSMVGTLKYMSPEQVQGQPVDARSDLFAAGVVLYQLLTGQRPFDGDSDFAIIQRIVAQDAASPSSINPQLPTAIDAVVARALAKSRDQRFASAREFDAALQASVRQVDDPSSVAPANATGLGKTSTWTGTMRAGESLVDTHSGLSTGTSAFTSTVTQELELVYWKDVKDSTDAEDLQGFLGRFPTGLYADLARRRLRKLGFAGADDGSSGFSTGTGAGTATVFVPRLAGAPEQTKTLLSADTVNTQRRPTDGFDSAWDSLETRAEPKSVQQLAQGASGTQAPVTPSEGSALAGGKHDANAAGLPPQVATPAAPWRSLSAVAGLVLLAGAGLGYMFLADSSGPVLPAAVSAASVAASGTAPASAPTATPAVAVVPAASAVAALGPASAGAAASVASSSASAASSPALRMAATVDKDKQPKAGANPGAGPTVTSAPAPAAASAQNTSNGPAGAAAVSGRRASATDGGAAARGASANLPAVGPRQACEDRSFIAFQNCMAEQCAKPAFTNSAACVERRLMDQRRREAELSR